MMPPQEAAAGQHAGNGLPEAEEAAQAAADDQPGGGHRRWPSARAILGFLSWTVISLVMAAMCCAAMRLLLRTIAPGEPVITCGITAAVAFVACMWTGLLYSRQSMPAFPLLLLALLELCSAAVSMHRQLVLLGCAALPRGLIAAYLLPAAITVFAYAYEHIHAGAPSAAWVLRSVQFAAGTSLWLHGSSLLPMAVPLDPVAAYLLGLPTGWAAWAGLLLIMSQATAAVTNEALQDYLETLLRNGHQADVFDDLPANAEDRKKVYALGVLAIVGVFLLVVWDMALWRIIFSAPSLPAPGPLASTGS